MQRNRICCNCGRLFWEDEMNCWICKHNTRIATEEEISDALQRERC